MKQPIQKDLTKPIHLDDVDLRTFKEKFKDMAEVLFTIAIVIAGTGLAFLIGGSILAIIIKFSIGS